MITPQVTLWTHPQIGTLKFGHDGQCLHYIRFLTKEETPPAHSPIPTSLAPLIQWFDTYAEHPQSVDIISWSSYPHISGTPFQESIWETLSTLPAGITLSYQELAKKAGHPPQKARAVAGAVAKNPFIILVPCHRILRHSGELGGYSGDGGIERKRQLLLHEGIKV